MNNDIRLVKFVNGEHVIAKVEESPHNTFLLLKPIVLMPVSANSVGMRPWLIGGDFSRAVEVDKQHVIIVCEVEPELAREYNEKYHDGIVTPTPQEVAAVNGSQVILEG